MTQKEYLAEAKRLISDTPNDERKIEVMCETFLTLAKASVRDREAYDCSQMISADSLNKDTVLYRLSELQYVSALCDALGWETLWDDLVFDDFTVSIDGNNAMASIVKSYTYYRTDGFDKQCFRRGMYTFELSQGLDGWEITDVRTNDRYELSEEFEYKPIDVKGLVDAELDDIERVRPSPPGLKWVCEDCISQVDVGFLNTLCIVQTSSAGIRWPKSVSGTFDLVTFDDKGVELDRRPLNQYFSVKKLTFKRPVTLVALDYNGDRRLDVPIGFPVCDGSGEFRYIMFTVAVNGRISVLKTRGYKEDGFIYSLGDVQSEFDVLKNGENGETGISTVVSSDGSPVKAKYVWDGFRFVFSR